MPPRGSQRMWRVRAACRARRRAPGSARRGGCAGGRESEPAPRAGALHGARGVAAWLGPWLQCPYVGAVRECMGWQVHYSVCCRCTAQPASGRLSIAREGLQQQLGALSVAPAPKAARRSKQGVSGHAGGVRAGAAGGRGQCVQRACVLVSRLGRQSSIQHVCRCANTTWPGG